LLNKTSHLVFEVAGFAFEELSIVL